MKEYKQIIEGYYENKEVKGIDILNNKPLTKDFFKTRPDMKQRVEKAINTKMYLPLKSGALIFNPNFSNLSDLQPFKYSTCIAFLQIRQ